jgi:hypothetical protein
MLGSCTKVEAKRTTRVTAGVANFMALCYLREMHTRRERDYSIFLEGTTRRRRAYYSGHPGVYTREYESIETVGFHENG